MYLAISEEMHFQRDCNLIQLIVKYFRHSILSYSEYLQIIAIFMSQSPASLVIEYLLR